jgi:hypothetical protein
MKFFGLIAVVIAGVLAVPTVYAQQALAPAGSTGQCKDGSYTSNVMLGACADHQGVKAWYGGPTAAPAAASGMIHAAAPVSNVRASTPAPATAAPGGGHGMVWANTNSKVYHCPGDKWYGKTKKGEYLNEADAKAKGFHADHGKVCTP